MAKRLFDLVASLVGLLLLSPGLLLIAVLIKLDSAGPVFFRQVRVGQHGRHFRIWKFRTMVDNAESVGPKLTVEKDRRVTRVGKWLRPGKLDELPQLLNVLLGEMSLVGPRPEVPEYVAHYTLEERKVLECKPGITDAASIAFVDEEQVLAGVPDPSRHYAKVVMPQKISMDLAYARHATLWSDIRLIFSTFRVLLFGKRPHRGIGSTKPAGTETSTISRSYSGNSKNSPADP